MDINSLERFVEAQENTYEKALSEIKKGKKLSHWMWYIFPQLRGLGMSTKSYEYGIAGLSEAKAYLEHPLLCSRLVEITTALLEHKGKKAIDIFGDTDTLKLHSSMTLFALASEGDSVFLTALELFFDGKPDTVTEGYCKNTGRKESPNGISMIKKS